MATSIYTVTDSCDQRNNSNDEQSELSIIHSYNDIAKLSRLRALWNENYINYM